METHNGGTDVLAGTATVHDRVPGADVYETADAYMVMLDLPGARKETISLVLQEGELRMKADSPVTAPEEGTLIRNELPPGGYARAFALGEGIDLSNVDARFENGVLTVKLFKTGEHKPREITIH
jgi:HSP20 family protein